MTPHWLDEGEWEPLTGWALVRFWAELTLPTVGLVLIVLAVWRS